MAAGAPEGKRDGTAMSWQQRPRRRRFVRTPFCFAPVACLLALCSIVALTEPAHADDHELVLAPDVDVFVKLSDRARLLLLGDMAHDMTTSLTDGEVGAHLDYTLRPRLRSWLQEWLVQRAQADLRNVDGDNSRRYRYRFDIEREFNAGGTVMVPYAQAEFFHETRYETWSRRLHQVGVEIKLTNTWRVEPYLSRQNDSRSASANVDTLGFVLKYFR